MDAIDIFFINAEYHTCDTVGISIAVFIAIEFSYDDAIQPSLKHRDAYQHSVDNCNVISHAVYQHALIQ